MWPAGPKRGSISRENLLIHPGCHSWGKHKKQNTNVAAQQSMASAAVCVAARLAPWVHPMMGAMMVRPRNSNSTVRAAAPADGGRAPRWGLVECAEAAWAALSSAGLLRQCTTWLNDRPAGRTGREPSGQERLGRLGRLGYCCKHACWTAAGCLLDRFVGSWREGFRGLEAGTKSSWKSQESLRGGTLIQLHEASGDLEHTTPSHRRSRLAHTCAGTSIRVPAQHGLGPAAAAARARPAGCVGRGGGA